MNKEKIDEIYRENAAMIYKYLCGLTRDSGLAEELTQETFFKALQKIDDFRGQCEIRVWLCQIGKNAYYDYLRRNRRFSPIAEQGEMPAGQSLELDFEKKETVYRLHRILHNLNEPYKEVFSLRTFGELSFREISCLFGKSESWAKMTYLRAKRKIREEMEDEDHM